MYGCVYVYMFNQMCDIVLIFFWLVTPLFKMVSFQAIMIFYIPIWDLRLWNWWLGQRGTNCTLWDFLSVQPGKFPLDRLSWSQFFSSRSEGELVREVEVESWINRDSNLRRFLEKKLCPFQDLGVWAGPWQNDHAVIMTSLSVSRPFDVDPCVGWIGRHPSPGCFWKIREYVRPPHEPVDLGHPVQLFSRKSIY